MGTERQPHEERVRQSAAALLAAAERDPDGARALLPTLGDPASEVREVLREIIEAGRDDARAVLPMSDGIADWVLDQAFDVVAARLAAEAAPTLDDLTGPLTALALLPYLGLASVAQALGARTPSEPARASAPVVPLTRSAPKLGRHPAGRGQARADRRLSERGTIEAGRTGPVSRNPRGI